MAAALCVGVATVFMGVFTVKAVDVDARPMKSSICTIMIMFFVLLLAIMMIDLVD